LAAAVSAAFAALGATEFDEREWRIVAELRYPLDMVVIAIEPTGKVVSSSAVDRSPARQLVEKGTRYG
jgi:hypothetical protein